ncbi:MAG: DUF368 domain-containing protein [Rikenellaceae bacterium]
MKRTIKDYFMVTLKGVAMGAADVVPGVSGGTIAFITDIYEELLASIKSVDLEAAKMLFSFRFKELWKKVNGNFLCSLLLGIGISILSLAKLITTLLETHPIFIWAFFFGLVLASTLFVSQRVKKWDVWRWLFFALGIAIAYYITIATPTETSNSLWFIFLCGMIAICAMILPGISGSFILLLLGKYEYVMGALITANIPVIVVFATGAVIGIVSFSHLLTFLLKRYHDTTISILAGFMLGSLNKVWPWKEITLDVEKNILPTEFIWEGIVLMAVGFLLVYIIEKLSARKG